MKKTALLIVLVLLGSQVPSAAQSAKKRVDSSPPVAQIGTRTITDAELEALASSRLARVRNEEYNIKRQVLDEYITRALLESEAAARGITPAELEKREVEQKVMAVTDDQKRAVYESNAQAYAGQVRGGSVRLDRRELEAHSPGGSAPPAADVPTVQDVGEVLLEAPRVEVATGGQCHGVGPKTRR